MAVTSRNSWSDRAFSIGVWVRNGPCPRMVPQIAWNVTINIETLIPAKAEAERRPDEQGNRRIQEGGRRAGAGGRLVEDEEAERHRARADEAASSTRRRDGALGRLTNR